MKTVPFGTTELKVPNVVAGMMRIAGQSNEQIRSLYTSSRDAGIDFFDHADLYGFNHPGGGFHLCELRFAEALRLRPSEREQIVLQTKTGLVDDPWGYDQSYELIVSSAEESLKALGTDYLDVLLLHRPDALVEPEGVARAFAHLQSSGKVRAFGVSNHTPRQIELLKTAVRQPIVANQVQLSVTHSTIIAQGLSSNMTGFDDSITRDGGGLVDYAWITRHPAGMQVVLGTTKPQRVADAAAGSDIPLTRSEWYGLFQAAGHNVP